MAHDIVRRTAERGYTKESLHMATQDDEILRNINSMVDEEHALMRASEHDHGLTEEEQARLGELKVRLDQCWDLLRQRRAHREFGQNPDDAEVRPGDVVEHYKG
jgi:hypothetical protein